MPYEKLDRITREKKFGFLLMSGEQIHEAYELKNELLIITSRRLITKGFTLSKKIESFKTIPFRNIVLFETSVPANYDEFQKIDPKQEYSLTLTFEVETQWIILSKFSLSDILDVQRLLADKLTQP
jgi:hypothetical protein